MAHACPRRSGSAAIPDRSRSSSSRSGSRHHAEPGVVLDPVDQLRLPHHSGPGVDQLIPPTMSMRHSSIGPGRSNRTYDSRRRRRTQAGRNRLLSRFNRRVTVALDPSQDADDTNRPAATSGQTGQGKLR